MVHVIWREAGLVPHRWRQFKLSNDPAFIEKVEDVVGLYVNPPEHAVVLSRGSLLEPQHLPERITRRKKEPLVAERAQTNPSLRSITPSLPRSNPTMQGATCWMFDARLKWDSMAPFERPVVPPV